MKPLRYAIVGMKHRGTEELVASLPPDEPLTLVREPANKYDRNAVQVWARGKHVGYVPKEQNAALARLIDAKGTLWTPPVAVGAVVGDSAETFRSISAVLHKGSNTWPLVEVQNE